jgi:hypothetical protein
MDYPPIVGVIFHGVHHVYIHEEDLAIFRNLEHENQALRESIVHLQTNQILTSLRCILATQPNQRTMDQPA